MSSRFKYEAPQSSPKSALPFISRRKLRSSSRPWIFDTITGVRFQPSDDEDALLSRLSGPADTAFDQVVLAIMDRRRGYVCDWNRVASKLGRGGNRR
jgi:hypothetical protein